MEKSGHFLSPDQLWDENAPASLRRSIPAIAPHRTRSARAEALARVDARGPGPPIRFNSEAMRVRLSGKRWPSALAGRAVLLGFPALSVDILSEDRLLSGQCLGPSERAVHQFLMNPK